MYYLIKDRAIENAPLTVVANAFDLSLILNAYQAHRALNQFDHFIFRRYEHNELSFLRNKAIEEQKIAAQDVVHFTHTRPDLENERSDTRLWQYDGEEYTTESEEVEVQEDPEDRQELNVRLAILGLKKAIDEAAHGLAPEKFTQDDLIERIDLAYKEFKKKIRKAKETNQLRSDGT